MIFYDANLSYGLESNEDARPLRPCRTIGELRAALDRAGIAGGLVRTVAADLEGVVTGKPDARPRLKDRTGALRHVHAAAERDA